MQQKFNVIDFSSFISGTTSASAWLDSLQVKKITFQYFFQQKFFRE